MGGSFKINTFPIGNVEKSLCETHLSCPDPVGGGGGGSDPRPDTYTYIYGHFSHKLVPSTQ